MRLAIAIPVLALLASTSAAPAAASESSSTAKSCKARQNVNRVRTTSARTTAAGTAATTASPLASTATSASAVATSSAVSGGSSGTAPDSDIGKMLQLHDDLRAHYGAGKMTWSTELASYAQTVANTCKFEHSHGPYGENLAAGVGGGYNVERAFQSWADEAKDYDWNKPGFSSKTGHFTQVVWKATSELGCASAMCDDGTIFSGYGQKSLFVVCEYRKPGNVVDNNNQSFRDNVGTYRD